MKVSPVLGFYKSSIVEKNNNKELENKNIKLENEIKNQKQTIQLLKNLVETQSKEIRRLRGIISKKIIV